MAEAKESLKVFVSGGGESAGLSTVKALLQGGTQGRSDGERCGRCLVDSSSRSAAGLSGPLPRQRSIERVAICKSRCSGAIARLSCLVAFPIPPQALIRRAIGYGIVPLP